MLLVEGDLNLEMSLKDLIESLCLRIEMMNCSSCFQEAVLLFDLEYLDLLDDQESSKDQLKEDWIMLGLEGRYCY